MKAIEISRNGKKMFTAGLADGTLDARLIIRNQEDPRITIACDGADGRFGFEINASIAPSRSANRR